MSLDAMPFAAAHPRATATPLRAVPSTGPGDDPAAEVVLTRTPAGWAVRSAAGVETAAGLVEGMALADLVTEELGGSTACAPEARRSARGPAAGDVDADPRDLRVAALERTVAQLEHALAARVATERAIGVLAERHGWSPREAFESLRGSSRSQRRAVPDVAADVLVELATRLGPTTGPSAGVPPLPRPPADAVVPVPATGGPA